MLTARQRGTELRSRSSTRKRAWQLNQRHWLLLLQPSVHNLCILIPIYTPNTSCLIITTTLRTVTPDLTPKRGRVHWWWCVWCRWVWPVVCRSLLDGAPASYGCGVPGTVGCARGWWPVRHGSGCGYGQGAMIVGTMRCG